MGRVKLKIKKLENTNGRQATYAKRKNGIMKKANELSILCDIDIILLMFSPTGKPSLCSGKRSIEEVIAKFAQLTPQERAKRKLESLEALKKTFKKLDHDVNIQEFLGTSSQTIEELSNQANIYQAQLSELHKRLSYWTNPDKIDSIDHLAQMERSLRESLNQIQAHKENLQKQQLMSLECSNQFQNGIHMMMPFRVSAEQQHHPHQPPLSWTPNTDAQHIVLPDDQTLLPHRDMECSTSSSFGSYSGYFGIGRNSDMSNSGQENSMVNELSRTSTAPPIGGLQQQQQQQLSSPQFPYMPYNLSVINDQNFQPQLEVNHAQENNNNNTGAVDYHVNRNFDVPKHGFGTNHQSSWASTSGPYSMSILDDHLYPQQQN